MKTLEQMAEEAGFIVEGGGVAGLSAMILVTDDSSDDCADRMQRFAALVAERCAEIVITNSAYTEYSEDGASIAAQILKEFPKP